MINLNVNRIEARLNRPGPNLLTPVNYLVIGGGFGGGKSFGAGGQSGEFLTGTLNFQHGTSATFDVGRGGLGVGSTTAGLASVPSSSLLTYSTDSISLTANAGSGSGVCPSGTAIDIYPCNEKGTWVHDPSTYTKWAQDGGASYDEPGTGDDLFGVGGGQQQYDGGPQPIADFPWSSNRGGGTPGEQAGASGYNGTGAGGGQAPAGAALAAGDGGDGVVGFAIYDPNNIFDVTYTAPTQGGSDIVPLVTSVNWEGYRIWYFHGTDGSGTFSLLGRKS